MQSFVVFSLVLRSASIVIKFVVKESLTRIWGHWLPDHLQIIVARGSKLEGVVRPQMHISDTGRRSSITRPALNMIQLKKSKGRISTLHLGCGRISRKYLIFENLCFSTSLAKTL